MQTNKSGSRHRDNRESAKVGNHSDWGIIETLRNVKVKSYNERLKMLGPPTLETRRFWADMLEVFKILNGFEGINGDSFFRVHSVWKQEGSQLNYLRKGWIVMSWNIDLEIG